MNNPTPIISGSNGTVKTYKFELCPPRFKEYIPCLDNVAAINKLEATNRGETWERHCPSQRSRMCCLIATPLNYRLPIRWPKSRDEVGGYFVPHLSIYPAALFECVSMSELTDNQSDLRRRTPFTFRKIRIQFDNNSDKSFLCIFFV